MLKLVLILGGTSILGTVITVGIWCKHDQPRPMTKTEVQAVSGFDHAGTDLQKFQDR